MKKCVVACITMLLLIIPLRTTSTAADYEHDYNPYIIMSSQYISSYSATITPGTNGLIELNCSVIGTGIMSTIGIRTIQLQKYVSGTWTNVKTWNNYFNYNDIQASFYASYQGSVGSQYRAVITFFAENQNGSDSRVVTTSSVTAKS